MEEKDRLIISFSIALFGIFLLIVFAPQIENLMSNVLELQTQQIEELFEDNNFESIDI